MARQINFPYYYIQQLSIMFFRPSIHAFEAAGVRIPRFRR